MAALAFVEEDARVGRHRFLARMPAMRTGNERRQFNGGRHVEVQHQRPRRSGFTALAGWVGSGCFGCNPTIMASHVGVRKKTFTPTDAGSFHVAKSSRSIEPPVGTLTRPEPLRSSLVVSRQEDSHMLQRTCLKVVAFAFVGALCAGGTAFAA